MTLCFRHARGTECSFFLSSSGLEPCRFLPQRRRRPVVLDFQIVALVSAFHGMCVARTDRDIIRLMIRRSLMRYHLILYMNLILIF